VVAYKIKRIKIKKTTKSAEIDLNIV